MASLRAIGSAKIRSAHDRQSRGELMLLRRTGSVEYTDRFFAFACRDADLTEQQLVQIYTAVLVNPLKTDVALRRPATLDGAIMLARAYEQRMHLASSDPTVNQGDRSAGQSSASAAVAKSTTTSPMVTLASLAAPRSGKSSALHSCYGDAAMRGDLAPSQLYSAYGARRGDQYRKIAYRI
ncbi:hypothetical protein GUJ93_ZPchr0011g28704 [Zizania palustris]|uniref:Uncharacterized protein n=1 Tax=Zizania palustris TaxID=103762 RepID=A0A8J5WGI6_ZIZPA|nr:hypothetical protein GUJ93_ZPchr0011g28704 [Zizania palustris]